MKPTNYIHPKLKRLETIQDEEGNPLHNCFSSWRCDCCNDLAGERYTVKAIYWNKRSRISSSVMRGTHEVCPQCVYDWQ
jgi:hypothetical protein